MQVDHRNILLVVGAVTSRVLKTGGLSVARGIIQNLVEERVGIELEDSRIGVLFLKG